MAIFSRKSSYNQLLIILIIIFFLSPIVTSRVGGIILSVSFLLANLWQINTLGLSKNILFVFKSVAIAAFILNLIHSITHGWLADLAMLSAMFLYLLFVSLAIAAIGSRIFTETQVNKEVIRGGVCVFLMLGLLWSFLYQITSFFFPDSFNYPSNYLLTKTSDNSFIYFYFSFTTLTTLGYGDVTPATPFAATLTNAEAIVGQLYPSIYLAKLVALLQIKGQDSSYEEDT